MHHGKTKRNFNNGKKKTLRSSRKKKGGAGIKKSVREEAHREMQRKQVRDDQLKKEQFRNMIMNFLQKYKTGSSAGTSKAIDFIINGLKSNRASINTLVPVSFGYIPINKQIPSSAANLVGFVPALSVIIANINTNSDIIRIIDAFIQNTGNINLTSIAIASPTGNAANVKSNISALSVAVDKNNAEISTYLLNHGADFDILNDTQLASLNHLGVSDDLDATPSVVKLAIDTSVPDETGYDLDKEPEFWKPIFEPGQLEGLKIMIQQMIRDDMKVHGTSANPNKKWSVCEINKTIIPTYGFKTKNEIYQTAWAWYSDKPIDFAAYNTILCASFLALGIISYRMHGSQDYTLIFKGGKAVQIELSGVSNVGVYDSEDIDILILPNKNVVYEEEKVRNLAGHVAHLVRWFVEIMDPSEQGEGKVSVLSPQESGKRGGNDKIYKLSVQKTSMKSTKQGQVRDYRPFSDIDFREMPIETKDLFNQTVDYVFYIPELHTNALFTCNNIGSLLNEKIYYYAKYFVLHLCAFKTPIINTFSLGFYKFYFLEHIFLSYYKHLPKCSYNILSV